MVGEPLGAPEVPLVDRIARGELAALGPRAAARTESPNLRDYLEMALRGGFPQAALGLGERARRSWLDSYVEEIVTRDSQMAGGGYDSARLARFRGARAQLGRHHRRQHPLRGRGHQPPHRPALPASARPPPHHRRAARRTSNRLKRLSLASKRFLVDPSLLASVTGATDRSAMRDGHLLGRLLETLAVAQLRAQATVSAHRCRLYHLRQHHGRHEIDVVAELDAQRLVAFEIKATAAPTLDDARHLAWLRDHTGDQFLAGIVLHTGPAAFLLGDRLWALPISSLWN